MQLRITKPQIFFFCALCAIVLSGCQSLNTRFGCDTADYSGATELAPLKMPGNAMAVSKRYDIPHIPNNKNTILSDNLPPDYLKE